MLFKKNYSNPILANHYPKKQHGLIKWVIIVVVLLAAIGSGVFYFLFMGEKDARAEVMNEKTIKGEAQAIYVPLSDELIATLYDTAKNQHFLKVTVIYVTRDETVKTALEDHDPIISNSVIELVEKEKYFELLDPKGKRELRAKVLDVTRGLLPEHHEGIERVIFKTFIMD